MVQTQLTIYRLDPDAFRRDGTAPLCLISLLLLCHACLLTFWPEAENATNLLALARWVVFGYGHGLLVVVLVTSALLSMIGAVFHVGRSRVLYFVPQAVLLGVMGYGGVDAAWGGAYLDHTAIPWPHILADQLGYLTLFGINIWALVARAHDPNG